MLFASYGFLFFLAVLLVVYYKVPPRSQWIVLLLASALFYASFGPKYLIYIALTIVTTWFCALRLAANIETQKLYLEEHKSDLNREEKKNYRVEQKTKRTRMQALCILFNLGILAVVKYANFFIGNVNAVMGLFGQKPALSFVAIALPLGISYYTLRSISYIVDVGRGTVEAEENPFKVALFVSFFPQVVQGPISRFGELAGGLFEPTEFDKEKVLFGIQRMGWGFFKKLVVADRLMPMVTGITSDVGAYHGVYALVAMALYTIELYADFTGGIDITIGIGEAMGVTMSENFLRPYFSTSLKEYWRRWHITMCSWFRDYVFYPVSTSQWMQKFSKFLRQRFGAAAGKRLPVYVSSFMVWFATGLWHGANWNFIVWGLLNFAILMISEELEPLYDRFHDKFHLRDKKGYQIFMMLRTFVLVCALNLFDCYATVGETLFALSSVFTSFDLSPLFDGTFEWFGLGAHDFVVVALGIVVMFMVSLHQEKEWVREWVARQTFAKRAVIWSALFLAVLIFGAYGIGYDSAQFIYNRF